MQITIEDLSPVEKRVEFELPWSDVVPKLEKAYDSLRRGVRLPGFRPGKVPRALLEKMYKRQVEDEVARDLVEHSIGPGDPREPDPAGRAAHRRGARDQVGRAVQVHRARRGAVAGHAEGLHRAAAVAPAGQGHGRGGRRGAGGLPPPADRVQAGRGPHRRPATPTWCWSSCPAGWATTSSSAAQVAVDLENDAEGAAAGPGEPAARQADRRRADRGRLHAAGRGRCCRELAGKQVHLHVTIKEVREKKVPALDDEMAKDTGEAETLEGLRAKVRERLLEARRAAHQGRDDARADQGAGQAQRVRRRARADRALRAADRQPRQAAADDDGHRRRGHRRREDARGAARPRPRRRRAARS